MDGALYKAAIDGRRNDLCGLIRSVKVDEMRTRGQNNSILHVAAKSGKLLLISTEDGDDPVLRFLYHQNEQGNTPLHIAAKLGHVEMTKALVERARKTDVEQQKSLLGMTNNEEDTALHQAVRHNRLEVVKLLIQEDADLATIVNGEGDSPLFMAVDRGFYDVSRHILNNAPNCSHQGRNGMSVSEVAVIRSKKRRIQMTGAEVSSVTIRLVQRRLIIWGHAVIVYLEHLLSGSCISRRHDKKTDFVLEVLKKLEDSTLEQADDFEWTPLHYAAHNGNEVLVQQFLNIDSKSLAYSRNREGMSALHIAAKEGNDDVIRLLMESCPEICELLDYNSRTALHIAVESNDFIAVEIFLKSLPFQDLINLKDNKGNTALHVAATLGDFYLLRMLMNGSRIDKGALNNEKKTFVDLILSNKELQNIEIMEIMEGLQIENVLPPRFEENSTKEAESNEKKKDEIQVKENEGGLKELDKKKPSQNIGGFGEVLKDLSSLNLLIATFIATATFAASVAIPGGYNDQGLPVLYETQEFKKFLCHNRLAFVLSTTALLLHFFLPLFRKVFALPVCFTSYLTAISLCMMGFAFDNAMKIDSNRQEKRLQDAYYTHGISSRFYSIGSISFLLLCSYSYGMSKR